MIKLLKFKCMVFWEEYIMFQLVIFRLFFILSKDLLLQNFLVGVRMKYEYVIVWVCCIQLIMSWKYCRFIFFVQQNCWRKCVKMEFIVVIINFFCMSCRLLFIKFYSVFQLLWVIIRKFWQLLNVVVFEILLIYFKNDKEVVDQRMVF